MILTQTYGVLAALCTPSVPQFGFAGALVPLTNAHCLEVTLKRLRVELVSACGQKSQDHGKKWN